ncbi:hypothetical protein DACRYDRAFT_119232 [Dacryopinax primogenitus]|uniref:PHD-type domain-containing protein n=1 Tax=Dacryopinax primogenitus (strain DJM 731) TaxID=1858805 RepID=M5FNJ4_DACPD|nr:uncharacterized protein DACRYDRAFT_119232 [Dacryopinax primogenitus]EJT97550.1 hypothetical protein DACRYDRAFT_119232 [Dacryopinax primogenitus]
MASRMAISSLLDGPSGSPSPAGKAEALPSLAEVTAGLSSPKHRYGSVEDNGRHEDATYYAHVTYYPPPMSSPHTQYAGYPPPASSYAYPPAHLPTYGHTPPSAYQAYERPYSRHSIQSTSSHSRSPELPTSLGVTGMKRKRSDEGVVDPTDRERDVRSRYGYSDMRETYEPVPPPPHLSPSHSLPPSLPPLPDVYIHYSREPPVEPHYYAQPPHTHPPRRHTPPQATHTPSSGEHFPRQQYYQHAPAPSSYAYPPSYMRYSTSPAREHERVSPHAESHHPSYAPPPAPYQPYHSPTSSYAFLPARHSQSPYGSRPVSGNREPIIATPYAVPRTETSSVVEMALREEERRKQSGERWVAKMPESATSDVKTSPVILKVEEATREEPVHETMTNNGVHGLPPPDASESTKPRDEVPLLQEPTTIPRNDESHQMEQPVKAQIAAAKVLEVEQGPAPEENFAPPADATTAQSEPQKPNPKLVVEVEVKAEPPADMDIDIVSESPAATVSVPHQTPVETRLPIVDRSPSLASTVPLATDAVEPSPAPTIPRRSTLPDAEPSPAPIVLRVEPSPAPIVLRNETKEEPTSPVLNVDVPSPPVSSIIRQPPDALPTSGNDIKVPESTQLTSLVDAALHPSVKSETPAVAGKDDVEVDVVDGPEPTPDVPRGTSILSEAVGVAAEKAAVSKGKPNKSKAKSHHKASNSTSKTESKSKSKAKDSSKTPVAKDKDVTKPRAADASPVPAAKTKAKKSSGKQTARVASLEPPQETPEPAKADDEEDKEKDDRLYCVCETLYDEERFMIGCDKCDNWYHPACVGLEEEQADLIDKFFCPRCIAADATLNTTHKRPCARYPSCTNPSRLPASKYCSDECGQARVEEIYNMQPKSVQALIKKVVEGAKRPEGRVDPVTGRVSGQGKGEDAQLAMLEEPLQQVLDERAESERRLETWERRERIVDAIVSRWKHEQKDEGICGYDERLGCGWDEIDAVDPSEVAEVCQEGLKCDRHRGWDKAHVEVVARAKALEEENLQDLTLRERNIRRDMERVEVRRKVVQRTWHRAPDALSGPPLPDAHLAPEVIDVKIEV